MYRTPCTRLISVVHAQEAGLPDPLAGTPKASAPTTRLKALVVTRNGSMSFAATGDQRDQRESYRSFAGAAGKNVKNSGMFYRINRINRSFWGSALTGR